MEKRTARLEWTAVAILLLGAALATTGVMAIVANGRIAALLIVIGAVVFVAGGVLWVVVVKAAGRRQRAGRSDPA